MAVLNEVHTLSGHLWFAGQEEMIVCPFTHKKVQLSEALVPEPSVRG